jgi:hypothetical protein
MKYRAAFTALLLSILCCQANSQQYYAVLITGDKPNIDPGWMPPGVGASANEILLPDADDSYWNDTFTMRKALVNNGWDPNNIFVYYYDGQDYLSRNPRYRVRAGENQITTGSATPGNVEDRFSWLANHMSSNDVLFIWTYDHGYTDYSENSAALQLYAGSPGNYVFFWDTTFARYVNAIPCSRRIILMAQCYSGGFIDNLQVPGVPPTAILTATTYLQLSY